MAMLNNQMVIHLELDSVFKGNLHPTSSPSPCWFCVGSAWLEPLTITTVHMSKIWTYQCMWFIHHVHPSFINLVFQNNLEIWHVYNRHLELNQTRVRPCEMRHLGFDSPLPPQQKTKRKRQPLWGLGLGRGTSGPLFPQSTFTSSGFLAPPFKVSEVKSWTESYTWGSFSGSFLIPTNCR